MTAITIPSLSGLARMVPVVGTGTEANVGANAVVTVYTVPDGRVAALDWINVTYSGGTAPTTVRIEALDNLGALSARLVRLTPTAVNNGVSLTNTIWLPEGAAIRLGIVGGDATTDFEWGFAGRQFDWVDVT